MKIRYKDYFLFILSVMIVGTAITLITNAGVGATAITSLPFVISEIWDISFGMMTAIFNIIWVFLQIIIQKREFPKVQFLQFFISILLGFSVDLSNMLLKNIIPTSYYAQIIMLIIGCMVMGLGIFLQLTADVVYNPAEGIVSVISEKTNYDFSTVKTLFDVLLVILSILLGLVVTGSVIGIREGTIISALIIGPFIGVYKKIYIHFKNKSKVIDNI